MVTFSVDGDWGEIIKKPFYPALDLFSPIFVLDMADTTMQPKKVHSSCFCIFSILRYYIYIFIKAFGTGIIQSDPLCNQGTLLKMKVRHDAIEEPFCLNGSIRNL